MALLRVLAFDPEGRPVAFDTWHDDLQLYLLSDLKDSVSLFDHVSGAVPAPPATADDSTRSQWLSRDATARLAIRNHLLATECAQFGEHRTAQALLLLPYLFPELSAFATVADLVTHMRTSDSHYRATVPADFLPTNQPPMFITLYFIVTRFSDSLRSIRDHFLTLHPTSLTVDLLEQHLLAGETSAVAVGAARGTPRSPFFEGCSPSPLSSSFASAAAADVSVPEDVGAASTSAKHRNSKGKGGRGGGGGSGGGGGGSGNSSGGGGRGVSRLFVVGDSVALFHITVPRLLGGGGGGSCGGGGGSVGSGGSGGGKTRGGRSGPRRTCPSGGQGQHQQRRSETQTPKQLHEWLVQRGVGEGSETCPYVIRTGFRAGHICGKYHTERRCFARLDDAWRTEFGDDVERPHWAELLRSGVAIFDLDYDVIISAMYALSFSAEGDCYRCVPPDPGIAAAALGASASGTPPGTSPAEALHTFTLDSGASRCFFRDSTTLTPLPAPIPVRLADPSGDPVVPSSSTVLLCLVVPSGSLSRLHLPLFSTNLVSTAALQDAMVTTTTHGGSSLYTLATEPPQVAASAQVSVSGQVAASCSCRLLSPLPATPSWHALPSPCLWSTQVSASLTALACPALSSLRRGVAARRSSLLLVSPDDCSPADPPHGRDLPVLRLHSDRGGEFSSNLLWDLCRGEGITQSFTLPKSPQKNGIAERRIGLVMEVARTSMIHADAPHFQWPFAVRYAAHQLNLWPRVSLPETSPTLRWTGRLAMRRCSGSRVLVLPSQDVTFDESVPFYRLFPYRSAPPPPPPLFLAPAPPPPGAAGAEGVGAGVAEVGGPGAGGAGAAGARAVDPGAGGAGGTVRPRPYFVPLLQQVLGVSSSTRLPPPFLCPPPDQSLRQPSPEVPDPESDRARAASSTVARLLDTAVTDPSFESAATFALVAELLDFAAACRLDYASTLVAESVPTSPPSVGGECALGTDVLEDRQEDFECLAAAVPQFASLLLAPEGDPHAPDIPTPRSYAEAITGSYSSQWQAAMDAEMASWKSTGTYVDEVPPPGANIVDSMWIFWVKRPPGSAPAFKARYVARGFSQRQGVDYFQTFSPTLKMTTLRVLLHVAA
ncbi:unnamed protein product [Closterium sp. NIES-53]